MQLLDWIVMAAFFLVMLAIGWGTKYLIRNTNDYFTGGGKMPWWLVGISHHMSGYSAVVFTAYAGIAYKYGFTIYIWWAVPITIACFLGVWVFAPRWSRLRTKYKIESPMEYVSTRYDVPTQQLLAWWGVLLKVLDVGAKWAALAVILSAFTNISLVPAVLLSVSIGLFYSTIGGLWAGTLTDFAQFIIQFAAGVIMFAIAVVKLNALFGTGGLESISLLWEKLPADHSRWFIPGEFDAVFAIGFLLVCTMSFNGGTWNLAQRYIAAPTGGDAKKAAILSASLYLVWPLVLFFPMWAAPLLLPDILTGLEPGSQPYKDALNGSYCTMVMNFLPPGLVGLMLASLVAHTLAMTTADATAITAVLTRDIVPKIWPPAASYNEKQSLFMARFITFAFMVSTAVIAVFKDSFGDIIGLIVGWFSALVGPVAVPMILGLLPWFRRCGSVAAFVSVFVGIAVFFVTKYNLFVETSAGVNMLAPTLTSMLVYILFGLANIVLRIPPKPESDEMLRAISSEETV